MKDIGNEIGRSGEDLSAAGEEGVAGMSSPGPSGRGSGRGSGPGFGRPALVLLGVKHTTAPIEIRERLAIGPGRLAEATELLARQPGVREALIVSTCNRVELLLAHDESSGGPGGAALTLGSPDPLRFLDEYFSVSAATIAPHLYEFREREAVRHLFRVASSLDSLVVGEAQILGQVKDSYTVARSVGAVRATLDPLLQRAFLVAKRVRTETRIGSSSVSIASVAVDLARKIFGSLQGKQVLIVGAGKMAELAARHLLEHGAGSLMIANRTEGRARMVADRLLARFTRTPVATTILSLGQIEEHAHRADIVITSTGAGGADEPKIFSAAQGRRMLERRRNRPMFFIDIAVPRDIDPALNDVDGCFVYDIDDLQQVAAGNLASRSREAAAAETIVQAEVERYESRMQGLDAVPAIRALQKGAEELRQAELRRTSARLAGEPLTAGQMAAVEALTRSLTTKLLQAPMTALRAAAQSGDREALAELEGMLGAERGRGTGE